MSKNIMFLGFDSKFTSGIKNELAKVEKFKILESKVGRDINKLRDQIELNINREGSLDIVVCDDVFGEIYKNQSVNEAVIEKVDVMVLLVINILNIISELEIRKKVNIIIVTCNENDDNIVNKYIYGGLEKIIKGSFLKSSSLFMLYVNGKRESIATNYGKIMFDKKIDINFNIEEKVINKVSKEIKEIVLGEETLVRVIKSIF